jgi:hypothetical protein
MKDEKRLQPFIDAWLGLEEQSDNGGSDDNHKGNTRETEKV